MATGNFTTYDLLVDIVPGALIVGLAVLLFRPGLLSGGSSGGVLLTGVLFIATSYAFGRIVLHSLSGRIPVCCLNRQVVSQRPASGAADSAQNSDNLPGRANTLPALLCSIVVLILNYLNSSDTSDSDKPSPSPDFSNDPIEIILKYNCYYVKETSDTVQKAVKNRLREEISSCDGRVLQRYGEGILYQKSSIYGKYNAISMFCRQMVLAFPIGGLLILLYIPQVSVDDWLLVCFLFLAVGLSFALGGYTYLHQRKWIEARTRGFFNDLHIALELSATD